MLNKNTKKSKKGFTLTEVLVVVLIIGVISAIAYPVYTKSINKSRAVEAINLLEMVRNKQIANFARRGEYLPNFTGIGQLTSNAAAEVKTEGDAILTVNGKYELAMNNATNCMSAAYIPAKGKPATFTFSSSYEDAGLGCDGDVCKTFGNIVGSSSSVCNCGTKTCSSPYVQNAKTCACDCPLACREGGCHDKNPARTETRNCGYNNSGTQTRTCPESCSSECSTSWSSCSGQSCNQSTKPDTTQNCANCGQKTQSVTCENGTWKASGFGACVGSKTDTQACDSGYTGNKTRTCTNDVWGTWNTSTCKKIQIECSGEATTNCANCGTKSRTCDKSTGTWSAWNQCEGAASEDRYCSETCSESEVRVCTNNVWGEWSRSNCDKCAKECPPSTKPASSQNCASGCGTQTRSVSCNTSTGNWQAGSWSGVCSNYIEEYRTCGNTYGEQTRTCRDKCDESSCTSWSACECESGFVWAKDVNGEMGPKNTCTCMSDNGNRVPCGAICEEDYMCADCGGTWRPSTCSCDCGFYQGNSCRFVKGRGCLCGNLYRQCR